MECSRVIQHPAFLASCLLVGTGAVLLGALSVIQQLGHQTAQLAGLSCISMGPSVVTLLGGFAINLGALVSFCGGKKRKAAIEEKGPQVIDKQEETALVEPLQQEPCPKRAIKRHRHTKGPYFTGSLQYVLKPLIGISSNVYMIGSADQRKVAYAQFGSQLLLHDYNSLHAQKRISRRDFVVVFESDGQLSGWNARTWWACQENSRETP